MARRRLAVAVLAPDEASTARVDALRQALGVREPFNVAPHCTLIPPTNVREEDRAQVVELVRSAAAGSRPFGLDVGPVTTFAPVTPTVHLAVGGPGVDELRKLRATMRSGPLDRPDAWPSYQPHVTLLESSEPDTIESAVSLLSGAHDRWAVRSVHLLEQRPRDRGQPDLGMHWVPTREEPLGGPTVVGRGGVEIALRVVEMIEEPVAALCGVGPVGPLPGPVGSRALAVVAEPVGEPDGMIGAAVGRCPPASSVAELDAVVVVASRRHEGIGRHLVVAWCSAAADRGSATVVAPPDEGFLASTGFVRAGRGRQLRYVR